MCLKLILALALVSCFVSHTIAEEKLFSDSTDAEFKQLCHKNDVEYVALRKSVRGSLMELLENSRENCLGSNHQNLIRNLVNETLRCADKEHYPSHIEIDNMVQAVTKKLCSHYKLANFEIDNKKCIEQNVVNTCKRGIFRSQRLQTDEYFYILAMTHLMPDCDFMLGLMNCTKQGIKEDCGSEVSSNYTELVEEFASILKCKKQN